MPRKETVLHWPGIRLLKVQLLWKGYPPSWGHIQEALPSCIPRAAASAAFCQSSSPTKSSDLRRQSYCRNVQISIRKKIGAGVGLVVKKDKKIFNGMFVWRHSKRIQKDSAKPLAQFFASWSIKKGGQRTRWYPSFILDRHWVWYWNSFVDFLWNWIFIKRMQLVQMLTQ